MNIIMPVNENSFPAWPVIISSQNNRITAGGKFLCIEARLFEALHEPICTRFNVRLKLCIGRYGRKPKKFDQIIKRITKELGIRVTPHQFRHLAAAFILEKDPANYEFIRRVLGHKNLETTIKFYVGLETVDAVRKFSAIALEEVDWKPKR